MKQIKICGLTNSRDIEYVNEAGVDYAGFVLFFPKSKRNITTREAEELFRKLRPGIKKVAVVVGLSKEQLLQIEAAGFDCVQIHGDARDEVLDTAKIPIWKAFNVTDLKYFEKYEQSEKIAGYVFDAHEPGSGIPFDWKLLSKIPPTKKLKMLAGGLAPDNISGALRLEGIDGFDTSSGVENEAGTGKSREKILAFARAVRNPGGH